MKKLPGKFRILFQDRKTNLEMSFKPAMSITFLCAGSDTSRRIQRVHVVVENLRWNGYVEIIDLHSDISVSHQHLKTNRYKEIWVS